MATENLQGSNAWVLALDHRWFAAIGERELVHLVETPTLLEVPTCPYFCRSVLAWNDRLLPAIDLAAWLQQQPRVDHHWKLAGIVAYQPAPGVMPDYGALLLADIPERLPVTDAQACPLPEQPPGWRELALSCFRRGEDAIPILDLPYLFTGGLLTR
ncbi:MAG: hypothetical protein H6975_03495 [Gammaproteobacteria bacterium]|nr:hypothetical protein [Gammaproteobacteria bacterium]